MAVDPLDTLKTILSTNWNSANTDNLTPQIIKITDIKRIDFATSKDWILIHRSKPSSEAQGIGTGAKQVFEKIDVDIRSGETTEAHWLKVIDECTRIFDSKIINPSSDYDILDPDIDRQDLSDKMYGLWRYIITVQLNKYNKLR